ncbi:MAG: trypsin-like peptidase domain-containing protein [Lachnospiraceae bacterium]|nr:trypsin-like peptidase domain-containing protein [Lachnospiraceae bacterium]
MTRHGRKITALLLAAVLAASIFGGCGKDTKKGPYSVRFDLNGGDRVSGELRQEVEKGEAAKEPKVEREGYIFGGWDTDFSDIKGDTVITAIWKKAIYVTFDANGGEFSSGKDTAIVASGKKPQTPTVKREGYTFTGWDKEVTNVTEDTTYVAQWKRDIPAPEEVYASLSGSMVEIHTYDKKGQGISLGSGFFIDETGTVLTNFHVMEGAYSAEIVMYDSKSYRVTDIVGYDKDIDLCVIKTAAKETKAVTFFEGEVKTGETVYTIGSSIGLTGTFSNGIVSTASRKNDGVEYIQITAPISKGNSGGPLVNEFGEVLGVNTFQMVDGQNLNFAVSIKELENVSRKNPMTIQQFGEKTGKEVKSNYTKVETGDKGEEVYRIANDIELEPNDSLDKANALSNGYWTAAYLNRNETDVFSLKAPGKGTLYVYLVSYYHDDDDYLYAYLRSGDGMSVERAQVGRSEKIDIKDYRSDMYMVATFSITNAGTYFIDVHLPNNYPYKNGCYYLIGYEWK